MWSWNSCSTRYDAMSKYHSAFHTTFHTMETAVGKLLNDFLLVTDQGQVSTLLSSGPHCCVWHHYHSLLLRHLQRYFVDGYCLKWFTSYLLGRNYWLSYVTLLCYYKNWHWPCLTTSFLQPSLDSWQNMHCSFNAGSPIPVAEWKSIYC